MTEVDDKFYSNSPEKNENTNASPVIATYEMEAANTVETTKQIREVGDDGITIHSSLREFDSIPQTSP